MKTITLSQLESLHACEEQVSLFRKTFGESVTISVELAEQYAKQFDFNWAANNLLPKSAYADYRKIRNAAYADYCKIRDAAYADYLRIRDAISVNYRKSNAAYADYCKIRNAAYADYLKIRAATFTRLYLSLEG